MILRWHAKWRRFRRLFDRSEWMVRLLGLPKVSASDSAHGLVMIQIDGLSHKELQNAIREGEMPFMARLMRREHYTARKMYSGLPSNTPSVQGELFYGVPCAVPAFGFFHKGCGRVCRMFEPESAREVEAGLAAKGEALLKDGSSYSNIYTGGAREPRWCAASMGWGTSTKAPGPLLMGLLAVINLYGFARAVAFGLLEIVIAVGDAIRGIFSGEGPRQEVKFILSRVGICVLLREWVTHAARMDIARGLSIVHLNLVGYDEQAHRRGPESAFAHWVLSGIDDSIQRIWRAAKNSDRRPYEVWIYSDHGQAHSTPYIRLTGGKTLAQKLAELLGPQGPPVQAVESRATGQTMRVRFLGGRFLQKLFPVHRHGEDHGKTNVTKVAPAPPIPPAFPIVTDFGPLALVYLGPEVDAARRAEIGERLAREAQVPFVLDARSEEGLRGWTSEGPFSLPEDADRILGSHPFREALMPDLERVRGHAHAGDLILLGWKHGMERPVTFANENGAHGGISPDECTAFVAMPGDLERELLAADFIRPNDLRRAALLYQGREDAAENIPPAPPRTRSHIRVMTYNVHSCIGLDQRHDPRRIARVIAHYHPDVVCLQELDVGHARSGGINQARQIAALLRLEYHFHSVREVQDQQYGNAILSRFPMEVVRVGPLPTGRRAGVEPRGALWVEIEAGGVPIQILNTHLGLWPEERTQQVKALLGEDWLGGREPGVPLIVCGDLNCGPGADPYQLLSAELADCQLQPKGHKPRNTWFSRWPVRRLDHIFTSEPLTAQHIHIPTFQLAKMASDHLPLVADILLPQELHIAALEAKQESGGLAGGPPVDEARARVGPGTIDTDLGA